LHLQSLVDALILLNDRIPPDEQQLVHTGKRLRVYSINVMRARHPAWFREDLARLFGLLATRAILPRVAERISFDEVAEAHRRLEAGGLEGQLVLRPDLPSRRDRAPPRPETGPISVHATPTTLL
jgi:NADPH:quinone reductase-like Zn-dependent oxidoreductase